MPDPAGDGFLVAPFQLVSTASNFDFAADHWRGVLGELVVRVSEGACGTGDDEVTAVLTQLNSELRHAGQDLARWLDETATKLQAAASDYVGTDEGAASSFDTATYPELAL
jgi:hypothetical protein